MKRIVVCLVALCLLIGVSAVPLKVHAYYSGDINIFSDGSVGPSDAPVSTIDNVTYVLTEDVIGRLFIYRDNITFDGSTHTISPPAQGYHYYWGIGFKSISNVTIMNCNVSNFDLGMGFSNCSNLTIKGNNFTGNRQAISLTSSNYVVISDNILNPYPTNGINVGGSNYLHIFNNSISEYLNGVMLDHCNNSAIETNRMVNNLFHIELFSCYNDSVMKNEIVGNTTNHGVWLDSSSNNVVVNNNVSENNEGFYLFNSSENTITGNSIENNTIGIDFNNSTDNGVYHNNFLDNNQTVTIEDSHPNFLDNGVEGNYWSDYNGTDNNQDGIGDTPYVIDANNTDHYPLMGIFQSFNVYFNGYKVVDIVSNSTIKQAEQVGLSLEIDPIPWEILLNVNGQNGTNGFCRITFPNSLGLNSSTYPVYVGEDAVTSRIVESNGTYTTLYFTYNQTLPNYDIRILPEFLSFLILPLFFITTLMAVIVYRKASARSEREM